jgi:transcriptional regulator
VYVPKHFSVDDRNELLAFVRREPFGIFISSVDGKPFATHAPIVIMDEGEPLRLGLHVARANPQWRTLDGQDVLAIFQGAHAMISASWYVEPHQNVPTWNYGAVHCSGVARLTDSAGTRRILERLVAQMEPVWRIEEADAQYIERMERAIVGIEVSVTQIVGSYKYSENRSDEDRERVIAALAGSSREMDREVSERMREMA